MTEETIFLTALEKATPAERAAFLDEACAGDPAKRQRVEALLRSHEDPDSFLDLPAMKRRAEAAGDLIRTTDVPVSGDSADGEVPTDVRALLDPGREPGSLGRLDHFEILEIVGRGGMGIVFKARDTRLQHVVAIKVLAPHLAASATARQKFFREARSAAAVRDDHVVSIHAVSDESRATPYLVMEFIAGVALDRRIKTRGALSAKEVLRIGMQAALGLAAAHRQGLIHRDVKPGNILLENGVERVKITDFGLARAGDDASLSQSGVIAGTPLYMSPEQARGKPMDARSDLFSLGSVLYRLCTGEEAFAADETLAVLKRVCEETPRPIREINPDIPACLAAVVDRLLAKEAGERFQTAEEVAEVLREHLVQMQQSGPASAPATEKPGTMLAQAHRAERDDKAAGKRKRVLLAAVLLLTITAGLVTIGVVLRPGPRPRHEHRPPVDDPHVLTVSKNSEHHARFQTITEALDKVEPGMTIRVLDDAVYEERLRVDRREQQRGVVLEATNKATIRTPPGRSGEVTVLIKGVAGFTLRGFRFQCIEASDHVQVFIFGACPGLLLEQLDMTANKASSVCVKLDNVALSGNDPPITIRNCTMRRAAAGILIRAGQFGASDDPRQVSHVLVHDNTLVGCVDALAIHGAPYKVHMVANRIMDCHCGILLWDLLPGAADVLVANNTLLRLDDAVSVIDDHRKGKKFLESKNFRIQNNLVLEPQYPNDMLLFDHIRNKPNTVRPGDQLSSLLNSPEWRFSHNWREIDPARAAERDARVWIPARPNDHLQASIPILSRTPDNTNFLRPPKDSPLGKAGAGGDTLPAAHVARALAHAAGPVNPWCAAWALAQATHRPDRALPAYVGAVPPDGVPAWDWEKTWKMMMKR